MYTIRWEANGILHECKSDNRMTARMIQEAIVDFWLNDGIAVQIWDGAAMVREEIS